MKTTGTKATPIERSRSKRMRLATIRTIVSEKAVDSQERFLALLRHEGFVATQATLSRDLKLLGIGKTPNATGGYTYTLGDAEIKSGSVNAYIQDFTRGFLSIEFSGGFGVMRTLPGHASSVAAALDHLRIPEVLGTIAGDDTILVIPRDGVSPAHITKALRDKIPTF